MGEVCADFLGLNDSQYQWIIDEHRRREAEVWLFCSLSRPATASFTGPARWVVQRMRRLRRLKALKAAREAREVEDMEGGASASMGTVQRGLDQGGKEEAEEEEDEQDETVPLLDP